LLETQYRTDANLAARQSIYEFQRARVDLPAEVIQLAGLRGDEVIADIGCGNGEYLAELGRRGHRGRALGVDMSAGMLHSARSRGFGAALLAGDATALPLAESGCDVALAMHMLYHVPDPLTAVRELRRVTRDGGQVLIVLNGDDHLRELRDLIALALADSGLGTKEPVPFDRINLDDGRALVSQVFASVHRHDFVSELRLPGSEPIVRYVRSTFIAHSAAEPERLVAAVTRRLDDIPGGAFRVRTHSGCLICM
jgi:ubiquinone/menaquinone biosynthesis C-methylase UbiE